MHAKPPDWDTLDSPSTYRVGRRWVWVSQREVRRGAIRTLRETILGTEARTILEVGCGEGVNLGLLAQSHPDEFGTRRWLGFDYSLTRTQRARTLLHDRLALPNVSVWNGDAKAISLRDGSVDLCFTAHVLEQMPYDWRTALSEMRRVATFVLLMEPIYELKSWVGKLHSRAYDYFRASIEDICAVGFDCLSVGSWPIHDRFNETTTVLLKVRR